MKRVLIGAAVATATFGFPVATAAALDPQDPPPTAGAPCTQPGVPAEGAWQYVDGENAAHYGWQPGWVCRF